MGKIALKIRAFEKVADHTPLVMEANFAAPRLAVNKTSLCQWDFDALAAALQAGMGRVQFLKALGDQISFHEPLFKIFEKDATPTRHAALLLEICKLTASQFFKLPPPDPWYKIEMTERRGLLAERASLRLLGVAVPQATIDRIDFLTKSLRAVRLREQLDQNATVDLAICHAFHARRHAQVHRFARLRAGTKIGVKNRDYRAAPSFQPTLCELEEFIKKPGDWSGFLGAPVSVSQAVRQESLLTESCVETTRPQDPHHRKQITKDDLENAKKDILYTSFGLLRAARRKYTPPWSVPTEVLCMALSPSWLSKPEKRKPAIGIDPFEKNLHDLINNEATEKSARRRLQEAKGLTVFRGKLFRVFVHIRSTKLLPETALCSQVFLSDKKRGKKDGKECGGSTLFVAYGVFGLRPSSRMTGSLLTPRLLPSEACATAEGKK